MTTYKIAPTDKFYEHLRKFRWKIEGGKVFYSTIDSFPCEWTPSLFSRGKLKREFHLGNMVVASSI